MIYEILKREINVLCKCYSTSFGFVIIWIFTQK